MVDGFVLLVGVDDGGFEDVLLLEGFVEVEFGAVVVEVGVGGERGEGGDFVFEENGDRELIVLFEVQLELDSFVSVALHWEG